MAIRVLGPLDTGNEHALSPRERAVLAALIVCAGRAVAPGELAEAYWGEAPPRTWPQQVKTSVARIRAGLGAAAVVTRGSEYALGLDPATIDAFEFERLVSAARLHSLHEEHDRAIDAYGRALALWRGRAYPELADWEPAAVESERLAEIRDSAEEELLEARLADGEHRAVIADAERLVRARPLRENRWAVLAMANYRAGRQAEALATVRAARERLADELGIDLGERLRTLEAAMLQQDPALAAVRTLHRVSDSCPYRGLSAFSPGDADEFFGREDDIAAIRDRAHPGSLIAVVGASGLGKSSLVLAGVVPRTAEGRRLAVVAAGRDTAVELRARMSRRGVADVIVIDQSEAVFQLDPPERDELCAIVAEALAGGATVLLTLRSDFLDLATGLPHIGTAVGGGVYALGPLSVEGLRAAIEQPAARAGLRLEPGLVEVIMRDAGDRRATLPHVSHALVETWLRREGATLTVAGYEASGGIAGAIAQSAETLYRSFEPDEADACRALMLRLVQRGPDGASVRRIAHLEPLIADPTRRRVLDRLVAARLLTVDGDRVMVAHEAVATAWPRLDGWLERDAANVRVMALVATTAEVWDSDGRRDEDLLRGARLQAAVEWAEASHPDLTETERALVEASTAREQNEMRALADQAAHEARSNRRLRGALAGAAVLLIVALVSGGVAAVRGREAASSAADAAASAEDRLIEAVTAQSVSLRPTNRDIAALMAVAAARRWPDDARSRAALMSTLTGAGAVTGITYLEGIDWRAGIAPIPDTDELAVARGTTLSIHDATTGTVKRRITDDLIASDDVIRPWVRVSADASTIAVLQHLRNQPDLADDDEEIMHFFDTATGRPYGAPVRVDVVSEMFTLSADGRYATWATPGTLAVVERDTGAVRTLPGLAVGDLDEGTLAASAFLPDGRIIVGTADGVIDIVDPTGMTVQSTLQGRPGFVGWAVVVTAGGLIASMGASGVSVWDAAGTELWHRADERTDECTRLTASSLSDVVACGDETGTVQAWRLSTGERVLAPTSYQLGGSGDLAVVDGGHELLLLSAIAPAVGRLRLDGAGPSSRLIAEGWTPDGGLDADGSRVLVEAMRNWTDQSAPPAFAVWDVATDRPALRIPDDIVDPYEGVLVGLKWLGDDRVLTWSSVVDADGVEHLTPHVVDVATGRFVAHRLPAGTQDVFPSAVDGRVLAVLRPDNEVVPIDLATLEPAGPAVHAPDWVITAGDTADGERIVVTYISDAQNQAETSVYDSAGGGVVDTGLATYVTSITLPDGDIIASNLQSVSRFDDDFARLGGVPVSIGGILAYSASRDARSILFSNQAAGVAALYDNSGGVALGDRLSAPGPGRSTLAGDGSSFALAGRDGVILWQLSPDAQLEAACRLAGREPTADEWQTHLGDLGAQHPLCEGVLAPRTTG
ncbi:hypothetical protein JNB62_04685 [Microbacterium jejuense]|uniref:DNA-binding transcriptional activator of the SARP family n=1 Tax=Microbacterium jejuense TaxID=1263637 RepID=A0ABS7HJH4_9MICO|nr:BTAD domain-containing putative transcriptional regulator [Microbacterium jejuense]MBW9092973.1 hypothetical protein [Microbacterium jejuense]